MIRITPKFKTEKFYLKGQLHNTKGPAYTHKFFDEKNRHLKYAVQDKVLSREGWLLNPLVKKQSAADSIKKKLKRLLK